MSREAYQYTLWRRKRWWPHDTEPVVQGRHVWLDLQDEVATREQVTDIILRGGGSEASLSQYTVDVTDPGTGETVTTLSPDDLAGVRSGQRRLAQSDDPVLQHVSDEALLRELTRRLRRD
jgi:hypothetical protein